ncbi:pseudaminic acid synthase [Candidatus Nomurabacteria bacterium RIFOXYB1_FULL_39_16]|uniref:Pseudaminic acid synthase n=1 Tax=Candidatus Nomurabacteria bacterium RIFOXYB1_FULL_39_16 TaxID=1801803 RepID=A0A1F6YTQ9_9BACT|nr:MAG: pseudaminic acid synthase [Candidatus Nomurabacteria bacterium RIFOXYB1_FULL_39_16]
MVKKLNIGREYKPFIIAEMSGNHNQSLEKALEIVDEAADAGADALKIQTYTADTITLNIDSGDFVINDPKSLWNGEKLYALYQKAHTPWEWHQAIFKRCKERGIYAFSTPFDETAVDFLESLDAPFYKIASFETSHLPLLKKIARIGKPIIMSNGLATLRELTEAVETIRSVDKNNQLVLLKCTSTYPASPSDANLATIPHIKDAFDCEVGLSDHTMGIGVSLAAIALGATVIEKHFTISRKDGGVDAAFSLEPKELKELVIESEKVWQSIGNIKYGPTENEQESLQFRRSIYISKDVKPGEILKYGENLKIVRPGFAAAPKDLSYYEGRTVKKALAAGTRVTLDILD